MAFQSKLAASHMRSIAANSLAFRKRQIFLGSRSSSSSPTLPNPCSVPSDLDKRGQLSGLTKGDMCCIDIRAVATSDGNSYIKLTVPARACVDVEG